MPDTTPIANDTAKMRVQKRMMWRKRSWPVFTHSAPSTAM